MAWQEIPLNDGYYVSESLPVSNTLCQNFFVNAVETHALSPAQLYPTPGLVQRAKSGDIDTNRGAHVMNSLPYFINGNALYRLDRTIDGDGNESFALDNLSDAAGEAISGSGRVSIADNGTQLCIVEPGTGNGWIYTESGGLLKITDPDFTANGNAEIVVFINGYFVFTTDSKKLFSSELNDGLSYNALDFGTAEADPDSIRSAFVYKNQLYVFGSETIEVFNSVAVASGFPFQRINGFVIQKGIAAPFSVTDYDGTFAFIGQGVNESPRIYIFTGNDVQAISTTPIDFALQKYSDSEISEAFVWSYSFRGATFCGWNLKDNTFAHEAKASKLLSKQIWHERRSEQLQLKSRWRINSLITAYGRLLVGDSEAGIIGEIDNDAYTDYGIFRTWQFSQYPLNNQGRTLFPSGVQVEGDFGQGLNGGEPIIRMDYSEDGRVFSQERFRGTGKIGQYKTKPRWQRLGSTRSFRIFRFTMTDPVRWVIHRVSLDVDA